MQLKKRSGTQLDLAPLQGSEFGHTGAAVLEGEQQGVVALPAPGLAAGNIEDRVHLRVGQISSTGHYISSPRDQGRREMLASTITTVQQRPHVGFGLGNFQNAYPKYASADFGAIVNHALNNGAEWAADGGIPFSLLLLSIAVWSFRKAAGSPWGIGACTMFVHSLAAFPLQDPLLALRLFALVGVLSAETTARC